MRGVLLVLPTISRDSSVCLATHDGSIRFPHVMSRICNQSSQHKYSCFSFVMEANQTVPPISVLRECTQWLPRCSSGGLRPNDTCRSAYALSGATCCSHLFRENATIAMYFPSCGASGLLRHPICLRLPATTAEKHDGGGRQVESQQEDCAHCHHCYVSCIASRHEGIGWQTRAPCTALSHLHGFPSRLAPKTDTWTCALGAVQSVGNFLQYSSGWGMQLNMQNKMRLLRPTRSAPLRADSPPLTFAGFSTAWKPRTLRHLQVINAPGHLPALTLRPVLYI